MDQESHNQTQHEFCRIVKQSFIISQPVPGLKLQIDGFFPLKEPKSYAILGKIVQDEKSSIKSYEQQNDHGRHNLMREDIDLGIQAPRRRRIRHQNRRRVRHQERLNLDARLPRRMIQAYHNMPNIWQNISVVIRREADDMKSKIGRYLIEAHQNPNLIQIQTEEDVDREFPSNMELKNWLSIRESSNQRFNFYPLQGRQILMINQNKKIIERANAIRVSLQTHQWNNLVEIEPRNQGYKKRNPLFFESSSIMCEITHQTEIFFEYLKIEYRKCQFRGRQANQEMQFLSKLIIEIDERQRDFVFCKGNDESTLIWYPSWEYMGDYVKKIQFYYYSLKHNESQASRVICDWPSKLKNCESVHIKSIIEMREHKFLLLLTYRQNEQISASEGLFIYERFDGSLRMFNPSSQPLYSMNTCLPGIVRLIFQPSNSSPLQQSKVYFISSLDETILAEDTWLPNSEFKQCFSNCLTEAGELWAINRQVQITHKTVQLDPVFATIFLLESIIGESTFDDLVCQSLQLMGLF